MITKFDEFITEVRFSEYVIDNSFFSGYTQRNFDDSCFITNHTFKIYVDGNKLRYNIQWNHNNKHNLIDRLLKRTTIKDSLEFKHYIKNILNDLFDKYFDDIIKDGSYSIWLSEYDISFILNINHSNKIIYFITLLTGCNTNNVINTIELKTTV